MLNTHLLIVSLLAFVAAPQALPASQSPTTYRVGPQDVLTVTVAGETDASSPTGKYTVDADGTLDVRWAGRIKVQGLTLRDVETQIATLLKQKDFITNPHVTVLVETFKSQKVWVTGEGVKDPGPATLTGGMTLLDVIQQSGGLQNGASDSIVVYRPKDPAQANGPVTSEDKDVDVIKISKRDYETGRAAQLVTLRNGDTIFVGKAASIYISGEVKTANRYTLDGPTTLEQALAMAGGLTDRARKGGITVTRLVNGKSEKVKLKMTDLVQPGDTIFVPKSWI
jgi:polysaccharide export outer membrane protein